MYVMSRVQTWSGRATEKSRCSRSGATGKLWLLSVVTLNRRLRLRRCRAAASAAGHDACRHECPGPAVASTCAASRSSAIRAYTALDMHQQSFVAQMRRRGRSYRRREPCVRGNRRRSPPAPGTARRSAIAACEVRIKAYFIPDPLQSTPSLFPICRAPSSRAPTPRASG